MWSIDQFTYSLPPTAIAQTPASPRDTSKLLVVDKSTGACQDLSFHQLPALLHAGDVLVRNNTKVLPARIFGQKETGGKCELLLLHETSLTTESVSWECLTKPGLKVGQTLTFADTPLTAICTAISGYTRIITFSQSKSAFFATLDKVGHTPIPPYIHWQDADEAGLRHLYQTTFAKIVGSAAAPTAGLHFTPELDERIRQQGVTIAEVTLHVGLGTFLPLQPEQIAAQALHHEWYNLDSDTATLITEAKAAGRQIIAVGTTTTRTLESAVNRDTGLLTPGSGQTELFIQPGYRFQIVDELITNFHLPESSLLMLIAAFTSQPNTSQDFSTFATSPIGKAYAHALAANYRFFSFGDAMFISTHRSLPN